MNQIMKNPHEYLESFFYVQICAVDRIQTLEMMKSEEDLKDIPVVFLTSVNDREDIEAVLKLQPTGYMLKPVWKDKLHEKIREVLN